MRVLRSILFSSFVHARYLMRIAIMLALMLISAQNASSQWTKLTQAGATGVTIKELGALAFRNGKLWFGRDKLYVSTDTGKTWTTQMAFPPLPPLSPFDPLYFWYGISAIDFTNPG